MLLFPLDGKPPVMFRFTEFLAMCIHEQFITMNQLKFFRYQFYQMFMFIDTHNDEFKHSSLS